MSTGWLLQRPWVALAAALIVETIVLVVGRGDFVAADPLWYASVAHTIAVDPAAAFASGDTHPFVMRIGLTVPLAGLYRLFGVSTVVSNLPSLLAALGVLVIAYAAAPTPRAKLLALLFGVTCPALLRHASVLNIDLPCAALMACTVLWLSWRDRPRGRWWLVGAAVAWIAAFLVKETALWCGVVWVHAIVVDVRALGLRAAARRFAPAIAVGAALAAGYAVLCARIWGSPWARFQGIEDLTYEHAWTLHGQGAAAWFHRLTWQPAAMLSSMFQALLVPIALAPWLVRGTARTWTFATGAFLLLYWLGSTSLSSYSPLPISQRMALPVLPGFIVLAALASDRALERLHGLRGSRWPAALAVGLGLAITVPGVYVLVARLARPRPETASFAALRDELAAPGRRVVLVCSEPRCVNIGGFYLGFEVPPSLTMVFAGDFARAPRPAGVTVRALVHLPRGIGARRVDPALDHAPAIEALALRPIVWDRHVRMYDAGDGVRLWEALRTAAGITGAAGTE